VQIQRYFRPASALPWIGVTICAVLTLVLGFYPVAASDILPLVR